MRDMYSWSKGYMTGIVIGAFATGVTILACDHLYRTGKREGMAIANEDLKVKLEEAFQTGFDAGRDEGIRVGSLNQMGGTDDGEREST